MVLSTISASLLRCFYECLHVLIVFNYFALIKDFACHDFAINGLTDVLVCSGRMYIYSESKHNVSYVLIRLEGVGIDSVQYSFYTKPVALFM